MRSLLSRLEKLENDRTGGARLILVRTGAGHTRADVSKMLKVKGITETPTDRVVCFATIYLDRDGNDVPADFEPELLSVH